MHFTPKVACAEAAASLTETATGVAAPNDLLRDLLAEHTRSMMSQVGLSYEGQERYTGVTPPRSISSLRDIPSQVTPFEDCPVDLALLREASDGDIDTMLELIELCLEQAEEVIPSLATAIGDGSAQKVKSLAHMLRGACATCGIASLVPPLQELERLGSIGELAAAPLFQKRAASELDRLRRFSFADLLTDECLAQ